MIYLKYIAKFRKLPYIVSERKFHRTLQTLNRYLDKSPNAQLDKNIFDRYMCLPVPECKLQATYIWIDATGICVRSKTRTLDSNPTSYKDVPLWGFDGSNTDQAEETNSDCYLVPIAMYSDPIRRGNSKLVLCEAFDANEKPCQTNHRQKCVEALNKVCDQEAQFSFKQDYLLMGTDGRPFGWPEDGEPIYSGDNHAAVGATKVVGREIAECFYRCCLYCGIDIFSGNQKLMRGQWEFQIGPTLNIKSADDVWMARWLIQRIAEDYGVDVSFCPKYSVRWPGSGLHVIFSTRRMRDDGGYKHIEEAISKLEKTHKEFLKSCDVNSGEDNKKRLVGKFSASHADKFNSGVGNSATSVKIEKVVAAKKKGNFEDRRPGASADPYQVIAALIRSILNVNC